MMEKFSLLVFTVFTLSGFARQLSSPNGGDTMHFNPVKDSE